MPRERTRAIFKVILPGLIAGGLCGAAVGLGLVERVWGIVAAIGLALFVGMCVLRVRHRSRQG